MVAREVTTLQLFAAETCNKFLKIEHHDSIVYNKHELILTFLAGATSDLTASNTTQERLDLPARFLQQILLLPYFTMFNHRYMTRNRIGNHPRTPIDTPVFREIRVNVLLLLKVSKKPLRNNSTEARRF